MKRLWIVLLLGGCPSLWAGQLPKPPPLGSQPVEEQNYFEAIYANHNNLAHYKTGNPNGVRDGRPGELIWATFGGNDNLCENTGTGTGVSTTWTCINITTPSSCTPGGVTGEVLFDSAGTCGEDPGFTYTAASQLATLTKAIAGDYEGLRIVNSQPNAGGDTSETAQLRFGFGTNNDAARLVAGKSNDFINPTNSRSFLSLYADRANVSTEFLRAGLSGVAIGPGFNASTALHVHQITSGLDLLEVDGPGSPGNPYLWMSSVGGLVLGDHNITTPGYSLLIRDRNTNNPGGSITGAWIWLDGDGTLNNPSLIDFGDQGTVYGHFMFDDQSAAALTFPSAKYFEVKLVNLTSHGQENPYMVWTATTFPFTAVTMATERAYQFQAPSLTGTNPGTTITKAATVYIDGAPAAGANMTLTNAYALWVASGSAQFDGGVNFANAPSFGGFTQGSVLFAGSGGTVSQNNAKFFWNDTNARLNVGTTSGTGMVTIDDTGATSNYALKVVSGTVLVGDHLQFTNTLPSISACGATPNGSVVGNDNGGKITIGGGAVTSCTMSFAHPWTNAPACVTSDGSQVLTIQTATTQSAMTLTTAATMGGDTVSYICMGRE